jgi:hypothetical protein
MDPYELQERQRLAEEAAEKVIRDVPRIRVEELVGDDDNASLTGDARSERPEFGIF